MKKKVFLFIFTVIALAGLSSCGEKNIDTPVDFHATHFIINAGQPETKSFIVNNNDGTYTPKWSNGDRLAVFFSRISESTTSPEYVFSNKSETGISARFEGEADISYGESSFLSFAPADAFAGGNSDGTVCVDLGRVQHPANATIDQACDILVAKPCSFVANGDDVVVDDLYFRRPFSILKINLKGAFASGEKVKSLTFSCEGETLSGQARVNLSTGDLAGWAEAKDNVKAEYSDADAPTINSEGGNSVYLVVNPTTLASGKMVTVTAETEEYYIMKSFTLGADMVFPAGNIAVLNLTVTEANCMSFNEGLLGTYTADFTSSSGPQDTGIAIAANTQYIIVRTTDISSGAVKLYNDATVVPTIKYTRLHGALAATYYKSRTSGNLKIEDTYFHKASDGIFSGSVTVKVYSADSRYAASLVPDEYVISTNADVNTGFASTTDLFRDLQFNDKSKTIYIESGEYDIYQEYADYGMPVFSGSVQESIEGYPAYNSYIPANSHVIGRGRVQLKYMPNPAIQPLTLVQSYVVSAVNVAHSMILENVEVYSKNSRYAIHDDPLGDPECTGAVKKYINVKCYKYSGDPSAENPNSNYGFEYGYGAGIDKLQYVEFDGCEFYDYQTVPYASFLIHDRQYTRQPGGGGDNTEEITAETSSTIVFKNTSFNSAENAQYCIELNNNRRKNWGPKMHIPVTFENCRFSGVVALDGSHPNDRNDLVIGDRNSFDVTFKNCGDVRVDVWDPQNEYPVTIINN